VSLVAGGLVDPYEGDITRSVAVVRVGVVLAQTPAREYHVTIMQETYGSF